MDIQNNQNDKPKGLGYFESFKIKKEAEFALTNSAPLQMMHYITSNKKNLLGQRSSFESLFLGRLFASQTMREMLCISRPEFALQPRAFQGSAVASFLRYASELASPALTILATVCKSNTRN